MNKLFSDIIEIGPYLLRRRQKALAEAPVFPNVSPYLMRRLRSLEEVLAIREERAIACRNALQSIAVV